MPPSGKYLYGFAAGDFQAPGQLLGLANAPVHSIRLEDIAAVVSDHPVEKLSLLRRNVEPHHRVIREISSQTTLIPATFGHISDNEEQILAVLRDNYSGIREELQRLAGKTEMGVKLLWDVDNIFDFLVSNDRELRNQRDRVFGKSRPTLEEKLELGAFFDRRLKQERERLGNQIIDALRPVTSDVRVNPVSDEKMVLNAAFLIERTREKAFEAALYRAAGLFDSNYALDYNGPWPPYDFVRLALRLTTAEAAVGG
ncbi:MAG: GvpL/GvpF family gas vesicle protein [Bryobacteraceae bacterium]